MMFGLETKLEMQEMQETKLETNGLENIKPEGTMTLQECKDFWKYLFSEDAGNEGIDTKESYYSTYEERMQQIPKQITDRGEWEKERGESQFIPSDVEAKDILKAYGMEGVMYEDAIPDFSAFSQSTVKIEDMTESRPENFKQCDIKCAEQWNQAGYDTRTDWTFQDVKEWRQEHGYSWHERNDMETCDLIPTKVNEYFGHLGGVSECRKSEMIWEHVEV